MDRLSQPGSSDVHRDRTREPASRSENGLGDSAAIETVCQQVYDVLRRLHAMATVAGPVVFQNDDDPREFDEQHELLSQALEGLHCHPAITWEALRVKLDCLLQLEAWFGPEDEWVTALGAALATEALAILAEPGDSSISRVRPKDIIGSWRLSLPRMFGRPDAKSGAGRNGA